MYHKIRDQHRCSRPSWKNTDARKWCTNHWDIAKCFLPATGYDDKESVAETDCSGILNIIINCLPIQNKLDLQIEPPNDVVSRIIKERNKCVHSASYQLPDGELNSFIDLMITLLQDKKSLSNDTAAQEAVTNLTKLKSGYFVISTKDETDIREEILQEQRDEQYPDKKEELQSKLCRMYTENFKTIPISPFFDETHANLDDVFAELVICDDLMHEPNALKKTRNTGKPVKGYRDILFKGQTMCKHPYIIGDAGIGKSTWCLKMVNTWVSACNKTKDNSNANVNNKITEDEEIMLQFDWVFLVLLRHGVIRGDIRDMIKDQLFTENPHLNNIASDVLEKEPSKCLVIMDGLDEWNMPPGYSQQSILQHRLLPGRRDLYSCPILTTTRPWKLEAVRLEKERDIDRAVKIQGVKNIGLLAEKVIKIKQQNDLESNRESKTYSQFCEDLKKSFSVKLGCSSDLEENHFLEFPFILIVMVCMWFEKGKLDNTWAEVFSSLVEYMIGIAEHEDKSGRLSNVTYLKRYKGKWFESCRTLPKCLSDKIYFVDYSFLLNQLARLAFEGLINAEKNVRLVFTKEDVLHKYMSLEEVEIAVKIGILSNSKLPGTGMKQNVSISFLHKIFQEYLAAIYICVMFEDNPGPFEIFLIYCTSKQDVYEMENVVKFIAGMNIQLANELSKHIALLVTKEFPERNDLSRYTHETHIMHRLQLKFYNEIRSANDESVISALQQLFGAVKINKDATELCLRVFNTNWNHLPESFFDQNAKDSLNVSEVLSPWQDYQVSHSLREINLHRIFCSNPNSSNHGKRLDFSSCHMLQEVIFENMDACYITMNSGNLNKLLLEETSNCILEIKGELITIDILSAKKCSDCKLSLMACSLQLTKISMINCETCDMQLQVNQSAAVTTDGNSYTLSILEHIALNHSEKCTVKLVGLWNVSLLECMNCKSCNLDVKSFAITGEELSRGSTSENLLYPNTGSRIDSVKLYFMNFSDVTLNVDLPVVNYSLTTDKYEYITQHSHIETQSFLQKLKYLKCIHLDNVEYHNLLWILEHCKWLTKVVLLQIESIKVLCSYLPKWTQLTEIRIKMSSRSNLNIDQYKIVLNSLPLTSHPLKVYLPGHLGPFFPVTCVQSLLSEYQSSHANVTLGDITFTSDTAFVFTNSGVSFIMQKNTI